MSFSAVDCNQQPGASRAVLTLAGRVAILKYTVSVRKNDGQSGRG